MIISTEEITDMDPSNTPANQDFDVSSLCSAKLQSTEQIRLALQICHEAHLGQTDKGGTPYIFHPIHLAEQMETEDEICTALLHDVLEDSHYTVEDLRQAGFSETVLEALHLLTHAPQVPYMEYVLGTKANPLARKVKLADLTHNSDLSRLRRPSPYDYKRQRKYLAAKKLLEEE